MELVLVRHGEAEERLPAFADANRALTARGTDRLKKAMRGLPVLLEHPDDVVVWTSPLLRATQSARIVADRCGAGEPEVREFLATGDFAAFADAYLDVPPTACLILVGHEPHLGDWCRRITGSAPGIGKGDAIGIGVESPAPPAGSLLWKIDRRTLARLDKRARRR